MGIKTAPEVLNKTPDEIRVVNFEFASSDLATGETITAIFSVTISPSGAGHLNKDSQSVSGTVAQLVLSAGVLNQTYDVDVEVTTSAGQKLQACGKMKVAAC